MTGPADPCLSGGARGPDGIDDPVHPVDRARAMPRLRWPGRPRPGVAWLVIALVVAVVMAAHAALPEAPPRAPGDTPDRVDLDGITQAMAELQGRYLLGAAQVLGTQSALMAAEAGKLFGSGSFGMRLRGVALAAEMEGRATARDRLDVLMAVVDLEEERSRGTERSFALSARDRERVRILAGLLDDEPAALAPAEREDLHAGLGWFGRLATGALRADDQARARRQATGTFLAAITLVCGAILGGIVGAGLLLAAFFGVMTGRLALHFDGASPRALHGIHAETFAVWLVLFLALQIGVGGVLPAAIPPLLGSLLAFALSLGALAWPVLRGVPFAQVRRETGLTSGRGVLVEIGWGLAGYLAALPLLAIGVGMTLLLMAVSQVFSAPVEAGLLSDDPTGPAHPIVEVVAGGGVWTFLLVLLVGSVAAPVIEETMFRGVLYQHLRTASHRAPRVVSVLVSALGSALVFAAVHPQGVLAIPVLSSLAIAFALVREARGSLIAPMVMHAVSNGIVLSFMGVALS